MSTRPSLPENPGHSVSTLLGVSTLYVLLVSMRDFHVVSVSVPVGGGWIWYVVQFPMFNWEPPPLFFFVTLLCLKGVYTISGSGFVFSQFLLFV